MRQWIAAVVRVQIDRGKPVVALTGRALQTNIKIGVVVLQVNFATAAGGIEDGADIGAAIFAVYITRPINFGRIDRKWNRNGLRWVSLGMQGRGEQNDAKTCQ